MKTTAISALVILNVLLGCTLIWKHLPENVANAQARRPGDYLIIPVEPQPGQQGVVCIIDTTNGEMSAIALDENTKRIVAMPRMNIADMLDPNAGRRNR